MVQQKYPIDQWYSPLDRLPDSPTTTGKLGDSEEILNKVTVAAAMSLVRKDHIRTWDGISTTWKEA
jgi:hypothetical protein